MGFQNGKWYIDIARVLYLILGVILGDTARPIAQFIENRTQAAQHQAAPSDISSASERMNGQVKALNVPNVNGQKEEGADGTNQ